VAGTFDWAAFERSLTDALVQAVRSTIAEYPDERLYAAAEACRGTTRQCVSTFRRYLAMLVRVCRRARTSLRTSGFTDRDFVVLLFDDEHYETLVKRILTRSEVSRHFPELDERAVELARLAALPEAERVAFYVSRLEASAARSTAKRPRRRCVISARQRFPT
jgi:hypothetical protein